MKKILTLICTLLCANVLLAQTYDGAVYIEDVIYAYNNSDQIAVVYGYRYENPPTDLVIPSTIAYQGTTYSVTSIGEDAFRRTYYGGNWVESPCTTLTSITIPNSVTYIDDYAFSGCSSLTSVTIPNSVTSIGPSAFSGCSSLTSVTIPNSVTFIGGWAFSGCSSLTSVTIGNSVTLIGYRVFSGCSSLTSVTIPNSVTSIGDYAFSGCSSLTSINIPNSVTFIDNGAFEDCSSLTSITIPNSVTEIGNHVFGNCSSLTSVTIPNSVTEIGGGVFSGCSSLTSVTLSNNITGLPCDYEFYYGFFFGCSSLTSITIPNSVTYIGDAAFYGCSSLTSVTCLRSNSPSLSNLIGGYVFDGTPNNKTLTIPCGYESEYTDWQNATTWASIDCIVTIGSRFTIGDLTYEITSETEVKVQACTESATSVVIPETVTYQGTTYNVTSIEYNAFLNCSSLTSVTIPNSVTYIGDQAFYGCSSLTSVTIPNSVTYIGDNAFYGCSSLTSVTIPNSVTYIGDYTFRGCSSLTSVTIPNSVTYIGDNAFHGCSSVISLSIDMTSIPGLGFATSLQNLTLGENVTSIASGAFNNCSFLQNITCLATTPPTLADNTVFPYPNIATLTVPCGTLEAYSAPTSFWNMFFMGRISENGYDVVANVNNDAFGSVAIENNCSTATLTATANACYLFVGWNDGNTENPRLVTLSSDTTLTANFEEIVFDTTITATINAGEMYSEFGFNESEAGTYVQNLQTVNGCDSTITLILDVNSSLLDVEQTEISFYPNPTDSKITFSQMVERIEVIDLTGRTIFTFSNAKTINIESLPSGAYYLRLTNNDKAIMRKVIKE